jgi:hypothetical protein
MTPLAQGIDATSLLAGFACGVAVVLAAWCALAVLNLVRRLISDAGD